MKPRLIDFVEMSPEVRAYVKELEGYCAWLEKTLKNATSKAVAEKKVVGDVASA